MSTEGDVPATDLSGVDVLLHICCGPCAVAPVAGLRDEGMRVGGFWFNPNIHPAGEYLRRLESCRAFAAAEELPLLEAGGYGLRPFLTRVWRLAGEGCNGPGARCLACYRWRLTETAAAARARGIPAISTTLLVSPYQQHDAIAAVGDQVAVEAGVRFVYRDWRPRFREARNRSRQLGLYHQQYCGCIFSEEERYAARKPAIEWER